MGKPRQYTPDEDSNLLARLSQGDTVSFEALVRKYVKRIFNLVYLLCGDAAVALESSHNAFVAAYREVKSLRSTMHFSTWLVVLLLREYRLRQEFGERGGVGISVTAAPGWGATAQDSPLQQSLRGYVRELSPDQGVVLVLHYVRGCRMEKMADILQIREDVLLSRLFAAQEQLASLLKHGAGASGRQAGELSSHHGEIRRGFATYLDNSAEEKDKELIRRHLGECGSCREALAELEWIAEHLKSLPDLDPPAGLVPAIMEVVRREMPPPPPPPPPVYNPLAEGKKVVVLLLIAAVSLYWYLAPHKEGGEGPEVTPPQSREAAAPAPAAGERGGEERGAPPMLPPSPLKTGGEAAAGRPASPRAHPAAAPVTTPPALPLPPPVEIHPAAPARQVPPAAAQQASQPVRPRVEAPPALPSDWGESTVNGRSAPRRAPAPKGRSGEVSVLLGVVDHDLSPGEIERAVTSLGGSITGRGYSGGRDILYTRIDVDNVMDLIGRLGKIGTVMELPLIPEGSSGTIDLIIRW